MAVHEFSETQRSKSRVWYYRSAGLRVFKPGDKILLLSTTPGIPLDIRYQGPYLVIKEVRLVDFIIATIEPKSSKSWFM